MKLFQKLIVAPAALGFLIPSASFAEENKTLTNKSEKD